MPTPDTVGRPDVVTGTLLVDSHEAFVLFDSGATYSFVSLDFVRRASLSVQFISESVVVSSPGGLISSSTACPGCTITIEDENFTANLMVIQLSPFDVILGMDWLFNYRAKICCFWKTVTLQAPSGDELVFQGSAPSDSLFVLASLFPSRRASAIGLLWSLSEKSESPLRIEDILVVNEFLDVFPVELPGMLPERKLEFRIDLVPGTRPISISPYRLARPFQEELKKQLDDLLSKGLIRRSVSPWGAPVLFTKKKDGSWRIVTSQFSTCVSNVRK